LGLWERHGRVVIVDVETTGQSAAQGGRVIEVGLVAVEGGRMVAEYGALINCGAAISYGAFQVHGISRAMLAGKPAPAEVWPRVAEFVGSSPLVAHNAPFDRSFVCRELALVGQVLDNRWHCTVRLARKRLPKLANHRLETVYRHLFGELPSTVQRHRALDDARLTARVWMELVG
jgi:DNA polymerase-3 subunit epsilon